MTRDKARKTEIRAAKQSTGRRYTPLARELARVPISAGDAFTLAELLTECTTFPHTVHGADCSCSACNYWTPTSFSSRILGVDVPHKAVLKLAGLLAAHGPDVRVILESLRAGDQVVLACPPLRLELSLTSDDSVELCRTPACRHWPTDEDIPWCRGHLADQDCDTLVATAAQWGSTRCQLSEDTPDLAGGNSLADVLVRAAAVHGWYREVANAIVDGCFRDEGILDEMAHHWVDPDMPMRIRHARDREHARLHRIADQAVRARRAELGTCSRCSDKLFPWAPRPWPESRSTAARRRAPGSAASRKRPRHLACGLSAHSDRGGPSFAALGGASRMGPRHACEGGLVAGAKKKTADDSAQQRAKRQRIEAERAKPPVAVWRPAPDPADPPKKKRRPRPAVPVAQLELLRRRAALEQDREQGWITEPTDPCRVVGESRSVRDIPAGLPTLGRRR